VAGRNGPAPLTVRVTHIFRREDDSWRLIHRHRSSGGAAQWMRPRGAFVIRPIYTQRTDTTSGGSRSSAEKLPGMVEVFGPRCWRQHDNSDCRNEQAVLDQP
jgi:hypothetical protein